MAEIKVQGPGPDEEQTIKVKGASEAEERPETSGQAGSEGVSEPGSASESTDGQEETSTPKGADYEADGQEMTPDGEDGPEQDPDEEGDTGADPTPQENPGGQEDAQDQEAGSAPDGSSDGMKGAASEKEGGLKGFFKKKKDKKDQQIEELTDRVRRQMAEFDNFRKRTEKEKAAMYEVGARSVIEKILPVVDNFERGLATAENEDDPFVDGMNKIYKQLMTTLEALDVKPIEAVGQEFNPDLHNAVMHVDDESVGDNIVVEELQKGYMYRDTVVRYSMVKVAN